MKILVVEDEPLIASFIDRGLTAEGYEILCEPRGDAALQRFESFQPDMVLLDVMLPGLDGFDVLGAIRAIDPALPVVMLTARDEVSDRVRGLDLGATDYLVKPFAFAELAARVRAHLRTAGAREAPGETLEVGALTLDLIAREVELAGDSIPLSAREFALLAYLMRHPGQVLSRQQILDGVWGYAAGTRSNVVDVYVGYLRRKLDKPGRRQLIETIHGLGYRLVAD